MTISTSSSPCFLRPLPLGGSSTACALGSGFCSVFTSGSTLGWTLGSTRCLISGFESAGGGGGGNGGSRPGILTGGTRGCGDDEKNELRNVNHRNKVNAQTTRMLVRWRDWRRKAIMTATSTRCVGTLLKERRESMGGRKGTKKMTSLRMKRDSRCKTSRWGNYLVEGGSGIGEP